jgi:hypothetical protein
MIPVLEFSGMCGPTGGEISRFLPEAAIGVKNSEGAAQGLEKWRKKREFK